MNNRILTAALGATTLLSACASESSNPIASPLNLANEVSTASVGFDFITAGGYHSCGIDISWGGHGSASCWGLGSDYRLGNGSSANSATRVSVAEPGGVLVSLLWDGISAGRDHTCGLQGPGPARCWGLNTSGQLGNNTTTASQYYVATVGGVNFTQVTAGGKHSCGIATTGAAYCWGDGLYGQLGIGNPGAVTIRKSPTLVLGGFTQWSKIEAGDFHTCGIVGTGNQTHTTYCWGRNNAGQLGNGNTTNKTSPTQVAPAGGIAYFDLTAGGNHTCARSGSAGSGPISCWGDGFYGQLGNGQSGSSAGEPLPTLIPGGQLFQSLSAGLNHTCGVSIAGSTYCWGRNTYTPGSGGSGQLGDGTTTNRLLPTLVSGSQSYLQVSAGYYHTTATKVGQTYSWGFGEFGQLGNGMSSPGYFSLLPVEVQ